MNADQSIANRIREERKIITQDRKKITVGDRRSGKTTALIKNAIATKSILVVHSRALINHVKDYATDMGYDITVLALNDLIRSNHSSIQNIENFKDENGNLKVIIDEAQFSLEMLINRNRRGVSRIAIQDMSMTANIEMLARRENDYRSILYELGDF